MPTIEERDLRRIWHPCAQMKDYEELPPMVIDHAKGPWLCDVHGKSYLDIVSSWWANLLGHSNEKINARIKAQLDRLEHVIFANFSHRGAIELAERLAALAEMYQPMMMDNIHVEAPDCYRCPFDKQRGDCSCECFIHAERAFEEHGHETAAMIVEPLLQGCAGMRIYPELYLQKLRALCDEYDVLLIADEIATGFGRTGRLFACERAGITPDIMCLSKGLTGGYMPMSITVVKEKIYEAFYADWSEGKAFMHSHTYAGNPLGCAAALAVLDILDEENILEQAENTAAWLTERLSETFGAHPNVGEIRHIGLIHALELVEDRAEKRPFDSKRRLGYAIYRRALQHGLLLRPLGDILYFNPPLNIGRNDLETAMERMKLSMDEVLGA